MVVIFFSQKKMVVILLRPQCAELVHKSGTKLTKGPRYIDLFRSLQIVTLPYRNIYYMLAIMVPLQISLHLWNERPFHIESMISIMNISVEMSLIWIAMDSTEDTW